MSAVKKEAIESEIYGNLANPHTDEMLRKLKETMEINKKRERKLNIYKFQKRFVTKQEIQYAKRVGVL